MTCRCGHPATDHPKVQAPQHEPWATNRECYSGDGTGLTDCPCTNYQEK